MADSSTVIKLPFEAGEHLCTWDLPDGKGGVTPTPGMLNVEPGTWPSAVLYGEMPIVWQKGPAGVATLPQRHEFECLVGQLASGAKVALLLGELEYWVPSQGRGVAALAVISPNSMTTDEPPTFSSIEFQIEGIEALVDSTPIAPITEPDRGNLESQDRTWSATINRRATWSWTVDDVELAIGYALSVRGFDGYEFGMTSSPTIRLTSPEALTIAQWWERWVSPLRRLVSVATAAPRGIQYLLGFERESLRRPRRAQVFGLDIAQSPINSVGSEIRKITSSVRVEEDSVSLLDLLVRWRKLEEQRHPLLETYGDLATMTDQHPRSRFLLLLQALEGLHGYENRAARKQRQTDHEAKREAFLARVDPHLDNTDREFLKKFLMKRPLDGLDAALIKILADLPVDVRPELETLDLTAQVRAFEDIPDRLRVESVLVKVRNLLAHGSNQFSPEHLAGAAMILDRVVRSETVRVLGAPETSRTRALQKPDR